MQEKVIDIKKLVKKSDSAVLKKMPDFILNLLAVFVRQNEINHLLQKYSGCQVGDFLSGLQKELNISIDIRGKENLPENGKCFFVANHPFGFADGLALTWILTRKYGNIKAIGNDVFMLIPQLRPIIAAVNVFGTNYRDYLVELEKVYCSDIPISHFPAGVVSRIQNWKITDDHWHKSFISKAVKHKRDIVPVYFPGRNSYLFYCLYLFRKLFRIKTNLELIMLPNEFFRKRNKSIVVIIGKPISYQVFDKTKKDSEWARWVKSEVYNLKPAGIN